MHKSSTKSYFRSSLSYVKSKKRNFVRTSKRNLIRLNFQVLNPQWTANIGSSKWDL
jgi:hypothetical protein